MILYIITPTEQRTLTSAWIEVETITGNLVIQDGYAPSLILLKPHTQVTIGLPNDAQESFEIAGGILEIIRTKATLILET